MWYSADETTLYHAYSEKPDFQKVITNKCTFDVGSAPFEVGSVSVVKDGDPFFMIAYGSDDKEFALYKSSNGNSWEYQGIVLDVSTYDPAISKIDGPYLFKDDETYRLFYQGKINGEIYAILQAYSNNITGPYTFNQEPVLAPENPGDWDGGFVMHPWVVKADKTYYMWYSAHNGTDPQRIGMAKSEDGITWVKSPGNPIFEPATGFAEPSVITDGETWQMWTMGTGGVINYLTATGPFEFQSIQAAVNAASDGDTIHVAAGTYIEDITIPAGKQLNFIGEVDAEDNPLPVIKGTLSASVLTGKTWRIENLNFVDNGGDSISLNNGGNLTVSNCTFDGSGLFMNGHRAIQASGSQLTVENSTFQNGWYVSLQGNFTSLNVSNSTFTNVKSGINVQGPAGNTVTIDNTDFSVIAQGVTSDTYGVRFASSSTSGKDLTITNSSFVVDKNDFVADADTYHSAIIIRSGATGTLKVENSSILGEVVNQATPVLDASPNWWGSLAGPGASQISGTVDFTPWCTNEGCTTFAPDVDGVVEISGDISVPGGILINEPGITVRLGADTVIQNDSPCFVIEASKTIIEAEPGAKCIPTGGSNGIDVAAGLNNITIDGLEIDGTGQETGDGIHFAGAVSNFVLADNKIHNLDGDGIEFAGEPTGVVDIAGNLFQNNTGLGINAGSFTVLANYNSWGNVAGAAAGDGASEFVDADPFTHADVALSPINTGTTSRVVTSLANVSGRPTVLKDGTLYHLWYGPTDTTLYHSVSTNPAEFPAGELVTFSTNTPLEVSSTAIIKEGTTFYMVAYDGTNNKAFALYSSTNGTAWTYVKQVFDGTGMADLGKIDAPFVFNDGGTYKLYFQKKSADGQRYDIYLATSATVDGTYTLHATNPVLSPSTDVAAWDGKFVMHPWVVKDGTNYYMWFSAHNGTNQRIGLATSTDGIAWTKSAANPVIGPLGEPTIIKDGTIWRMWHLAGGNKINYLTALNPLDLRQTLAYQVSANLVNVNAADVTITYPADLLTIAELTSGTDLPGTFDTSVPGQISFVGYKTGAALTKQGAVLFNVTFHTKEEGTGDITLSKAEFGMPGGEFSSTNVYLAAAVDTAEVEIKELPVLATDLDSSYYLTGEARTFTVTITNYGTTYTGAVLNLTLPTGVTVTGVPATIDLAVGETETLTLTFTSSTPGEKTIGFDLKDNPGALLFSTVETATVYDKPVITAAFPDDPYVAGEPVTVQISITNPDEIPGPFELVLDLPDGTTIEYGGVTYTCTETGCPPIPVTLPITTADLVITFPGAWTGNITMNLYDTSWEPDRLLATFTEEEVIVLGTFDVSGTVSMQGRSARAGVPLTLTGTPGTYTATSSSLISNNYVFEDVAEGTYTFMTTQPRYLNIGNYAVAGQDVTKSVTVEAAKTLSSLWLRGGNAIYTDNIIDDLDLGKVGLGYTAGITLHPDADVNFDEKINIQDLALVAGNYDLTSATAYGTWQP